MRLFIILICLASISTADERFVLVSDQDVLIESNLYYSDIYVGESVDSFTVILDCDVTYGVKVLNGIEQPAQVIVLAEVSSDDHLEWFVVPPEGMSRSRLPLHEPLRPIPDTINLNLLFLIHDDFDQILLAPLMEHVSAELIVHNSEGVASDIQTMGNIKALYR
jgi:hypothetical protein